MANTLRDKTEASRRGWAPDQRAVTFRSRNPRRLRLSARRPYGSPRPRIATSAPDSSDRSAMKETPLRSARGLRSAPGRPSPVGDFALPALPHGQLAHADAGGL